MIAHIATDKSKISFKIKIKNNHTTFNIITPQLAQNAIENKPSFQNAKSSTIFLT